jgi:glyoxylate/hydroxypyruvate reductase A
VAASTPEEAQPVVGETEIILTGRIPADLVGQAHHLKWLQSMNAGIENMLGLDSLPPDVILTRVVDRFGGPMAEYVFAELLARARQLDRLREMQRERVWEHFISDTLMEKTLGVAGLGSIGAEMVRKARAFDMTVYGLSRTKERAGSVDRHFTSDAWLDFVRDLDVLVLILPLTAETDGVVDRRVLEAMKSSALLVNVGRGKLVVEEDLIAALREGTIGGAILDVFAQEPLPPDSPFWTLPGVTVTPHVSGPSTLEGVGSLFIQNLERYLIGEDLMGVVDRARGY